MVSVHILPNSIGAMLWKLCHLQVQDMSVPEPVLPERCELMVLAKMVVNRVMKRPMKARIADAMLRRWNFGRG